MSIDVNYIVFEYMPKELTTAKELSIDTGINEDVILLKAKAALDKGIVHVDFYKDGIHEPIRIKYKKPNKDLISYADLEVDYLEFFKTDDDLYDCKKRYLFRKKLHKISEVERMLGIADRALCHKLKGVKKAVVLNEEIRVILVERSCLV